MNIEIFPARTAVVVIDLQKGITSIPAEPYSTETVIDNTSKILNSARAKGIIICLVRAAFSKDFKDALRPVAETSFSLSSIGEGWSEYIPQLNIQSTDILITKHQWGAFTGTELDLQLRRRGINTIILCGLATNLGVESTARFAYELGYNQIFVEDAMSARSNAEHDYTFKYIFPRLGVKCSTEEVLNNFKMSND